MSFPTPEAVEAARERVLKPIDEFADRMGRILMTGEKHPTKPDGWITLEKFDRCEDGTPLGPLPDGLVPNTAAWARLERNVGPRWEITMQENGATDPTDRHTAFMIRPKPAA